MKFVIKLLVFAAVILSVSMYITTLSPKKELYMIRFDTLGGTPIVNQYVERDFYVRRPEDPYKENHTFIGWFKDDICEEKFVFYNTKIQGNMVLFAGWEAIESL